MTSGFSFRTHATSELVVPRSIPIGFGAAFGSKISNSIVELLENSSDEPELAELLQRAVVLCLVQELRELALHFVFACLHLCGELGTLFRIGHRFARFHHLHEKHRIRFWLFVFADRNAAEREKS